LRVPARQMMAPTPTGRHRVQVQQGELGTTVSTCRAPNKGSPRQQDLAADIRKTSDGLVAGFEFAPVANFFGIVRGG